MISGIILYLFLLSLEPFLSGRKSPKAIVSRSGAPLVLSSSPSPTSQRPQVYVHTLKSDN